MKKSLILLAAATVALSANAKTTTKQNVGIDGQKFVDGWYIGINGGAGAITTHQSFFSNLIPNAGLRFGRSFTPYFSAGIEGNAYFTPKYRSEKFVNDGSGVFTQIGFYGSFNLMNMFGGYKGTPRSFEISVVPGAAWGHTFGTIHETDYIGGTMRNMFIAKAGLDFAYNFGSDKQWQVYLEPAINWALAGAGKATGYAAAFNINKSYINLNLGVIYKFKTSNGTHNFKTIIDREDEIVELNQQITDLRSQNQAKEEALNHANQKNADLKKALNDCQNKPAPVAPKVVSRATNLQPSVIFQQGKSNVERSQYANIQMIAKYMKQNPDAKIKILGYASPEGSKELNQKLSEARAEAVKNVLVKNYKADAKRITTEGLGATDKLFDEVEFNRVALFNDDMKNK